MGVFLGSGVYRAKNRSLMFLTLFNRRLSAHVNSRNAFHDKRLYIAVRNSYVPIIIRVP